MAKNMKTQIETPVMKSELTDKELQILERRIVKHFQNNPRFDRHDKLVYYVNHSDMVNYLGLAYTSSSSWAGLWPCNEEVYLDTNKTWFYSGFGMDMGGFSIAWLTDTEENEMYIFI